MNFSIFAFYVDALHMVPDLCLQVPEVDTAVRSLTVMWDGSLVVAANNNGTCYVWRLLRGTQVDCAFGDIYFILISISFCMWLLAGTIMCWTLICWRATSAFICESA